MPRTKKYPEWVQNLRPPGHSVKEKDGKYYLYKTTSVYRPGKNPTTSNEYVGMITEKGIQYSKKKKVNVVEPPRVVEYGFSFAIKEAVFSSFAEKFDSVERAEGAFNLIIQKHSERSYLTYGLQLKTAEELHINISCKEKTIEKLLGMHVKDLYPLKNVFLVTAPGYKAVSEVEPEAEELLRKLGVTLHA